MRATLIYNENARSTGKIPPEQLQEALQVVGYAPVYQATSCEEELDDLLQDASGLVVSAGGDGTFRAVATRLIGKPDVALTILPLGTANNIANTLSLKGTPLELIAGLGNPLKRRYDVGLVRAWWGTDYFLEGAGLGFFAEMLATYGPDSGKSVLRGLRSLTETMASDFAAYTHLLVDGQSMSDEFLLVEILNTPAVGPRLKFAPNADPSDGLFSVVTVNRNEREGFLKYMAGLLAEDLETLSSVNVVSARQVEVTWTGFPFHIDGQIRPPGFEKAREEQTGAALPHVAPGDRTIRVEIVPQALELWLPRPSVNDEG